MDETPEFSLAQLTDLADVTPRTIRYYIAQGLLPPPAGGGPASRYSVGHLDRLRLIRELQRQHLPLAEIRNRLERLSDEEVGALAASLERRQAEAAPGSALDYIRTVLGGSSTVGPVPGRPLPSPALPASAPAPAMAPMRAPPQRAEAAASHAAAREVTAPYAEPPAAPRPAPAAQAARSQWERIALAPDIELHVRRPLSRLQNRAVDRLVAIARQLLEEDPS